MIVSTFRDAEMQTCYWFINLECWCAKKGVYYKKKKSFQLAHANSCATNVILKLPRFLDIASAQTFSEIK